jgi:hypothetical protein
VLVQGLWRADSEPVTDPIGALAQLAGQMRDAVGVLGPMLTAQNLDGATADAFRNLLRELRQSLEGLAKLGIAEKQVELEQARAEIVTAALDQALQLLALNPNQHSRVIGTFLVGLGRGSVLPVGSTTVALVEDVSATLAGVVRRVLDRLDLTDEQWELARIVVPDELRRQGEAPATVRGEVQ